MAPNIEEDEAWKVSGISRTYPSYREHRPITSERFVSSGFESLSTKNSNDEIL